VSKVTKTIGLGRWRCLLPLLSSALLVSHAQAPGAKAVGTVKSIGGSAVVITTDTGSEAMVTFSDSSRIVRASPGQSDLKSAIPIHLQDIQVGDRLFARGQVADNGSLEASWAIVMKKSDIAQSQQSEREEWRRGVGGIVKQVDPGASTITVANSLVASGKPILVHLSAQTEIRRYAPDSVKFDDAKPSTLDQIKPGDQLRARGSKNAEGTEFTAQAIVSGSFRDIAGTVISTDAANHKVTVMDLAAKQPVIVKVSDGSELRKLPPMVAARIAMRLKSPDGPAQGTGTPSRERPENPDVMPGQGGSARTSEGRNTPEGAGRTGERSSEGGGSWRQNGGTPDFQQMLSRMPQISISDLNKGDAVMLVATEGSASLEPTTITLVAGVDPILTAAPNGTGMILSPWNLGAASEGGGDAAAQ
jgi:Domain of unknown function (DUF5666)